jgi:hypothetical protein
MLGTEMLGDCTYLIPLGKFLQVFLDHCQCIQAPDTTANFTVLQRVVDLGLAQTLEATFPGLHGTLDIHWHNHREHEQHLPMFRQRMGIHQVYLPAKPAGKGEGPKLPRMHTVLYCSSSMTYESSYCIVTPHAPHTLYCHGI